MVRLQIVLSRTEAEALTRWAISELRDPRDQVRFLLQRELQDRGLLSGSYECDEQSAKEESDE